MSRGLSESAAAGGGGAAGGRGVDDDEHDVQLDYYGKRLASCSSDKTVKIFDVTCDEPTLSYTLAGHDGPVWQVAWSHPKFGVLLASCSYDHTVLIHRETSPNVWARIHSHGEHSSSVNAIAWAPHEHGLALACASSDGNVSIISHQDDDKWRVDMVADSTLGVNAVSWAPYSHVGAAEPDGRVTRRLATGGCDNQVRVIKYAAADGAWRVEEVLRGGHSDWVRDVAWAPAGGMPHNTIASCSEDGFVVIWTQSAPRGEWVPYKLPKFDAPLWRLSWSITGNVLAVSSGDHKVTLWKQTLDGSRWMCVPPARACVTTTRRSPRARPHTTAAECSQVSQVGEGGVVAVGK